MRTWKLIYLSPLFLLLCCGCLDMYLSPTQHVKVPEKYPSYLDSVPPRAEIAKLTSDDLAPLTPEVRKAVIASVNNLKAEAAALRAIVETYQKYAETKNKEFDAYIDKNKSEKK